MLQAVDSPIELEQEQLVPALARLPLHPSVVAVAGGPALQRIAGASAAHGLYLCRRSAAPASLLRLESRQRWWWWHAVKGMPAAQLRHIAVLLQCIVLLVMHRVPADLLACLLLFALLS